MNRTVAWSLAFCLCWCAEQASAQGLLGKPFVSAQYLRFQEVEVPDDSEGSDINVGTGGRLQVNVPLFVPDSEAAWGAGIDGFGTFSGFGSEGTYTYYWYTEGGYPILEDQLIDFTTLSHNCPAINRRASTDYGNHLSNRVLF